MIAFAAILSIGIFTLCLRTFGVIRVGAGALATSRNAVAAMRDTQLNDDERERIVQSASIRLLGAFFSIVIRSAFVVIASFLPIWFVSLTGTTTIEDIFEFLSRWDVIVVATSVIIAGYVAWVKLWPTR